MQNGATMENNPILMRNFNEGKEWAIKAVYEYFKKDILYYAKNFINDHQQREEIIQDSFFKFLKVCGLPNVFKHKYFLYTIKRNACYDALEKNKVAANRWGAVVSLSEEYGANNISGPASDLPSWHIIQTELLIEFKA